IGTNAAGTAAIPNTKAGVYIELGGHTYPMQVGGSSVGAGNVVSGNTLNAFDLNSANYLSFLGNMVGTTADGTGALGNGGIGFSLYNAHGTEVGGPTAGEGNTIAYNGNVGIRVYQYAYNNEFRRNSIHDN